VNIGLLLDMVADGAPDRVVIGRRRDGLTAAALRARARDVAGRLLASQAKTVGFLDLNSEAFPVAMLGAALAGLPFSPVNYRLTDDALGAILGRLAPGVVIAGADMVHRIPPIDGLEVVTSDWLAAGGEGRADGNGLPFVDPEDIAILLFTSGTTGEPKAAVLRHRHLASYILGTVEFLGAGEDEAQLVSVPSYHIAGVAGMLSSLYSGRRAVYLPAFDPDVWVQLATDEAVTQAMVVPTMLGRILPVIEEGGVTLPRLRHLSYGGGRMPVDLIQRAITVLPDVNFVNAYGLTETSSTIAVLTPEDHRAAMISEDPAGRGRLGSVGRPLASVEVEIRSPEGEVLPTGERGEIHVRGEQVAGEYLGGSALGADGWFPTRDAGWLDEEGFLFLDGRLDDVIVRGAENISPGEIEDALTAHPAVTQAAVVGVPDPEWGEAVGAAVVLQAGVEVTASELQDWVKERLRSTKVPQVIQVRDELPHNETGKLLRRVIRTELAAGCGGPGDHH
jgi:acyl-CoA synthetase (AMP-forming)/AMP-acid ligase II